MFAFWTLTFELWIFLVIVSWLLVISPHPLLTYIQLCVYLQSLQDEYEINQSPAAIATPHDWSVIRAAQ
jgi:hypothetical protein